MGLRKHQFIKRTYCCLHAICCKPLLDTRHRGKIGPVEPPDASRSDQDGLAIRICGRTHTAAPPNGNAEHASAVGPRVIASWQYPRDREK
jgi:hypothetical protein